jgi:hypothetical protein
MSATYACQSNQVERDPLLVLPVPGIVPESLPALSLPALSLSNGSKGSKDAPCALRLILSFFKHRSVESRVTLNVPGQQFPQ